MLSAYKLAIIQIALNYLRKDYVNFKRLYDSENGNVRRGSLALRTQALINHDRILLDMPLKTNVTLASCHKFFQKFRCRGSK